jgi:hypothetical protein
MCPRRIEALMPSDNSINVSFEPAPRDTKYFRERRKRSRASRVEEDEELVISSAAGFKKDALAAESPKFVKSRLGLPNRSPGIGYIDDAITLELATRELKHKIKSHEDFCAFCKQIGKKRDDPKVANRREALQRRMRRRPRSDVQRLRSSSKKSSLRLGSY